MLSPWYSSVGVDDNLVLVLVLLVAAAQIPAVNVFGFPYTDTDEYHTIVNKRKQHESAKEKKKKKRTRYYILFSQSSRGSSDYFTHHEKGRTRPVYSIATP